jgi:hypothetical protein
VADVLDGWISLQYNARVPMKFFFSLFFALSLIATVFLYFYTNSITGMATLQSTVYIQLPGTSTPPTIPPSKVPSGGGGTGMGGLPTTFVPSAPSPICDVAFAYRLVDELVVTIPDTSYICVLIDDILYSIRADLEGNYSYFVLDPISYYFFLSPALREFIDLDSDESYDVSIQLLQHTLDHTVRIKRVGVETQYTPSILTLIQLDANSTILTKWIGIADDLHSVVILNETEKILLKFSEEHVWTLYTRQRNNSVIPFIVTPSPVTITSEYTSLFTFMFFILALFGLGYFHHISPKDQEQ